MATVADPGAPVATPLDWDEPNDRDMGPRKWHLRNVLQRLAQSGDPWAGIDRYSRSLSETKAALLG